MAVRLSLMMMLMAVVSLAQAETLLDLIKSRPDLSKMAAIIEADELFVLQLKRKSLTAFLPTNQALSNFTGPKDELFIAAHLSNTPLMIQNMGDSVTADMQGNPELFLSKLANGKASMTGWEDHDYYINNAMVVVANQKAKTEDGKEQVLHIIDEVLAPTRVQDNAQSPVRGYPTAADLLTHYRKYGLTGEDSVKVFKERVEELNQLSVFETEGENTYFVAIDKAITDAPQVLDEQVIHGHVIPGRALYTRPASVEGEEVESLAFTDNLKVLLKMVSVTGNQRPAAYYVTSNTVASDLQHAKGTAMARLIKANIPVMNGVMHLIDRPLMTTADSIMSYLQEEGGQLSEFYRLFREHQQPLLNRLAAHSDDTAITLFAPSNYAFSMVKKDSLGQIALNSVRLSELLKLHIVERRLTTDEIVKSTDTMFSVPTLSQNRKLYFAVNHRGDDKLPVVSVEGAGVNATVTTPNIVAKNGVIHIINRIMDIPSQTIFEKLQSNPSISITYNMSSQGGFNERFRSRDEKFTLFVPNNDAWAAIKKQMVSSYKKLIMGDFPEHVKTILQRHLIVGDDLSIKTLTALTNNQTVPPNSPLFRELEMTRGRVYFEPRVSNKVNEYYLKWNGIVARVVQSDIECVNGVVHIIDKVLMLRQDMTVAAAPATPALAALTTAAMLLLTATLR